MNITKPLPQTSFEWNWTDVCPTGLTPWIPYTNDLAQCFQQLCLQFPVLVAIAIFSAYHFGRQATLVIRDSVQIRVLYLRVFVTLGLAFTPLLRTYMYVVKDIDIYPSDILISCTECVTWIVHLGKLLIYQPYLTLSFNSIMIHVFIYVILIDND